MQEVAACHRQRPYFDGRGAVFPLKSRKKTACTGANTIYRSESLLATSQISRGMDRPITSRWLDLDLNDLQCTTCSKNLEFVEIWAFPSDSRELRGNRCGELTIRMLREPYRTTCSVQASVNTTVNTSPSCSSERFSLNSRVSYGAGHVLQGILLFWSKALQLELSPRIND